MSSPSTKFWLLYITFAILQLVLLATGPHFVEGSVSVKTIEIEPIEEDSSKAVLNDDSNHNDNENEDYGSYEYDYDDGHYHEGNEGYYEDDHFGARPKVQDPSLEFSKGVGHIPRNFEPSNSNIRALNWNLLREDVSLPAAVIDLSKLEHNLAWMQTFADKYGVILAPHGKTTMCPKLFQKQIQYGAWGMSLATAVQVKVAYSFGISRVLMVNQLIGKRNMEIISEIQEESPHFEFATLVDSAEIVNQLGKFFRDKGQVIRVLLEIGVVGGRAGFRDSQQEYKILEAIEKWKNTVKLVGVELYEGVLEKEDEIRQFLRREANWLRILHSQGHFRENPILISAGGSAWFDVVTEELTDAFRDPKSPRTFTAARMENASVNNVESVPVQIILRPGSYITHDIGHYKEAQDRIFKNNGVAKQIGTKLVPALRIWTYVQSIPETQLAIVTFGRRDMAEDSGYPVPALQYRRERDFNEPIPVPTHWVIAKMMDQHAFLKINSGDDLRVGDIIVFDISHPCTNIDKWRTILLMDKNYDVVDILPTYF